MPDAYIDAMRSPTLKHLRERWWNDEFTEFLAETLRPRPGNRILDVGCGEGLAAVSIGRLHISQIRLVGIDLVVHKVLAARRKTASHNQRVGFAAADACCLPFVDGSFDSIFCVAVLQHIGDVERAVSELARVTAQGGRIVAVEPDNVARYGFSSLASGRRAFELAERFFAEWATARGDRTDHSIGPKLPGFFAKHAVEPIDVRLFPVSSTRIGMPSEKRWEDRRLAIEEAVRQTPTEPIRARGREYLQSLAAYREEARQAGSSFVEIQNTMLFATVGQKAS